MRYLLIDTEADAHQVNWTDTQRIKGKAVLDGLYRVIANENNLGSLIWELTKIIDERLEECEQA